MVYIWRQTFEFAFRRFATNHHCFKYNLTKNQCSSYAYSITQWVFFNKLLFWVFVNILWHSTPWIPPFTFDNLEFNDLFNIRTCSVVIKSYTANFNCTLPRCWRFCWSPTRSNHGPAIAYDSIVHIVYMKKKISVNLKVTFRLTDNEHLCLMFMLKSNTFIKLLAMLCRHEPSVVLLLFILYMRNSTLNRGFKASRFEEYQSALAISKYGTIGFTWICN